MHTDSKYMPYPSEVKDIAPVKLFFRNYIPKNQEYLRIKRVFDILFSIVVILFILSWLLPIIALLIKIETEGPAFFVQKRVGKGGRLFSCYKLRTMVVNAYADNIPAKENDPRITRMGGFLRKSNMDELPQFFNVLIGRMSLIGPRPHMISDCNRFSSIIPEYHFRNLVRPGITGLAQVRGLHGPVRDFGSMILRYQYDTFYVRNASFQMDFQIIGKTITGHFKSIGLILKELVVIKEKFQKT